MSYLKTKDCRDYPQLVKIVYEYLNQKYGSSARVSDFFNLWRDSYGIEEYDMANDLTYFKRNAVNFYGVFDSSFDEHMWAVILSITDTNNKNNIY